MRTTALVLALAVLVVAVGVAVPAGVGADSGTISRDSKGPQPVRDHDPLGGPPTPRFYLLGQTTIFVVGVTLLVVAALLGAYTFVAARRNAASP
jgi:hypothetical protein